MPTTKVILENVFGMLGIFFWSFQLLPQVIDNYRAKTTKGLSSSMFMLWTLAALGFGSYAMIKGLSVPIIVQPHIFGFFSTVCFLQCFYYGQVPGVKEGGGGRREMDVGKRRLSLRVVLAGAVVLFLVLGGVEVAAYFATLAGMNNNVRGTIEAAGIIPVILLTVGFFPQYVDILRYRSVAGVSMVFIAGDAAGSVFSIISLALRDEFDLLAAMNYILVLVCDLVVVGFFVFFNKCNPGMARGVEHEREESV